MLYCDKGCAWILGCGIEGYEHVFYWNLKGERETERELLKYMKKIFIHIDNQWK